MRYIFVINGRSDKGWIVDEVKRQLAGLKITNSLYITKGEGDGLRYVRLYCAVHEKDEVCFVACGGSGTSYEVASGIIGQPNKSMAILAFGSSNDFTKTFPAKDFKSIKEILEGETKKIDIIKFNDYYAMNVLHVGFDSIAADMANEYILAGVDDAYNKGLRKSILFHRYNKMKIVADGEVLNSWRTLLITVANAQYYGGSFRCAPNAVVDDGLLEVCVMRGMTMLSLGKIIKKYRTGEYLGDPYAKHFLKYRRARHIEIEGKGLLTACMDGEIVKARKFTIDVLEKALTIHMPKDTIL